MHYSVESFNVSRVHWSQRQADAKLKDITAPDEKTALQMAARLAPNSLLAHVMLEGDGAISDEWRVSEIPGGKAYCIDGDVYILIYNSPEAHKALYKDIAVYESQFDEPED